MLVPGALRDWSENLKILGLENPGYFKIHVSGIGVYKI